MISSNEIVTLINALGLNPNDAEIDIADFLIVEGLLPNFRDVLNRISNLDFGSSDLFESLTSLYTAQPTGKFNFSR